MFLQKDFPCLLLDKINAKKILVTLECDVYLKNTKLSRNGQYCLGLNKTLYFMWALFDLANLNELFLLGQCTKLAVCYGWQIFISKINDQYYLNSDITILMNYCFKELILIIVCHCVNNHSKHFSTRF